MKIKVNKLSTIEIEIQFPSYFKHKKLPVAIMFLSENKYIEVSWEGMFMGVKYSELPIPGGDIYSDYEEITEIDFLSNYKLTEDNLRQKLA